MSFVRFAPVLALPLLPLLGACGDATAEAAFAGSVDTLANGAVHVKNPATGMWKEGQAWRLVEDLRIGQFDGDGPDAFADVRALEVDALGRIYVLEAQASEIRVFGADGAHVRTIGRKGGGPGEMKGPTGLSWDPQGRLWVLDQGNARFALFDTAGAALKTHLRSSMYHPWLWEGRITDDGSVYSTVMRVLPDGTSQTVLLRADSLAVPRDTLELPRFEGPAFQFEERRNGLLVRSMNMPIPFTPTLSWLLDRRGALWTGTADQYRVVRYTPGGDTTLIVERAWEPAPVSRAERAKAEADTKWFVEQGGRPDLSRIPGTKSAFHDFTVDDQDHLWVFPQVEENDERKVVDVFDPEGRYLGRVRSPTPIQRFGPLLIRGDRLYTIALDEMEVPYVVRYRIEGRGR